MMETGRRTCGDLFTLHLPFGPVVVTCDPATIRSVFTGDPAVLRAGEGNRPLEPVVGPESLLLLDGARHLRRRRLVLPPFHGERLQGYAADIAQLAREELATWPVGAPFALEPRMRAITLAVIVRVVFGIEDGERAAALRELIPRLLPDGGFSSLVLLPALRRDFGPWWPWRQFLAARAAVDALLYDEITRRRSDPDLAARTDVLSLLLQARDEDGAPLTDAELRDELMTLLLAGHETTATALAWAFELLHRHPAAHARAVDEARGAQDGGPVPWLDAVAAETLRLRPPLPIAARGVAEPLRVVDGHELPAGSRLAVGIFLVHRRADLYPEPLAFRPERFLDRGPDTYAWLPFGGGVRRCVGAAFAQLELREVLRTVLAGADLRPASARPERTRRRAVVLSPARGARAVVTRRRAAARCAPPT
jgi:cytochrome P450